MDDDDRLIRPDGLSVRRLRHEHRWSKRDLALAIAEASWVATGLRETLTPNELQWIEEKNERIPYSKLRLLARGLDCDPVDILAQ